MRYILIISTLLLVAGCADTLGATKAQLDAATADCPKATAGATYIEQHTCIVKRGTSAHTKAGQPYMDLIHMAGAYRISLAEQLDAGQMTETEFELEWSKFSVQLTSEALSRAGNAYAARSQWMASYGQFLQGVGAIGRTGRACHPGAYCY